MKGFLEINKILENSFKLLATVSTTPRLDAEILLATVLQKSRTYLFSAPEVLISANQQQAFEQLLQLRLEGQPIAYITGYQEFWSLALKVTREVLIPRPETELLVEQVLSRLPKQKKICLADLGTGSGAIALALAHECPAWQLWATDNSSAALAIAAQNAVNLGITNIEFGLGEWCNALPKIKFAAIISNPPYIAAADPHLADLIFEPSSALIAAEAGLSELAKIILQAPAYLQTNGWLLLEHGYEQQAAVADKFSMAGYQDITTINDLAGKSRVTLARWQ